jgi:PAS domain S-box-containing protein
MPLNNGEALKASELRYRRVFEAARDGILIVDFETGLILDANKFLIDLLGLSKTDFLQKHLWEIGALKDIAASQKNFQKLQNKNHVRFEDLPLVAKDGKKINVEFVSNVYEVAGEKTIQCNIRDITERKQLERQAQKRIKELQAFFSFAEITEQPHITLDQVYQKVADILPKSWQYTDIACARTTLGDKEFRTKNFRESTWMQFAPVKVQGAVVGKIEVGYLDERPEADEGPFMKEERMLINALAERLGRITERMRLRQEFQRAEQEFKAVFDHAADGILIVDPETKKFRLSNPTICRMLGYTSEEIENLGIMDIHPKKDVPYVLEQFAKQVRGESTLAQDLPVQRKDGGVFYADVNATPIAIGDQQYLMGFFHDTTERKKAEEEIKKSKEALQAKVEALERLNQLTLGRELKMMELKNKIKELEAKLNKQ